jgi:periplasmic protein TonB
MRKYTLLLSVTFHVATAFTLLIAPIFAAARLPGVHESIAWVPARVATPPALGDPKSVKPSSSSKPTSTARPVTMPTQAPKGISEETGPRADSNPGPFDDGVGRGVPDGVFGGDPRAEIAPPPVPAPAVVEPVAPRIPVRVGGGLIAPAKTRHVAPIYPPVALAARQQGFVVLEAVIAENGTVRDVRVLRSIPLLDQAAVDAVRQWQFTPTLLNGEPVPIVMNVTVNFQLR